MDWPSEMIPEIFKNFQNIPKNHKNICKITEKTENI